MKLTDDQWVARARARVAEGKSWETPPEEQLTALAPMQPAVAETHGDRCPYCEAHPALEVVRRYEVASSEPLLRCPSCYGFWAKGDALAHGVRDPADEHPSFVAAAIKPRCRACGGHLKPDLVCAKCGKALPALACPSCGKPMERFQREGITLDACAACKGTWFDVGEIAAVYGLQPFQDYAASLIDEHAADDEPPGWALMLGTVLRVVAPFI